MIPSPHFASHFEPLLRFFLRMLLWAWLVLLVSMTACANCGSKDKRVPFGLKPKATDPLTESASATNPTSTQNTVHTSFPTAAQQFLFEGATVQISDGAWHAYLALDKDEDTDLDLVALGADASNAPFVAVLMRQGADFAAPVRLNLPWHSAGTAADCVMQQGSLEAFSSTTVAAYGQFKCAASQSSERGLWLIQHAPLLESQLHWHWQELPATRFTSTWHLKAVTNANQTLDAHLELDLLAPSQKRMRISLPWKRDHDTWLRDTEEPQASLRILSQNFPENPDEAFEHRWMTWSLYEALCRESGRPRLRMPDQPGFRCRTSDIANTLWAPLVTGLAQKGKVQDALAVYNRAKEAGFVAKKDLRRSVERTLNTTLTHSLIVKASYHVPCASQHATRLQFADENRVVVFCDTPWIYDFATGTAGLIFDDEGGVLQPSVSTAAYQIHRTCDGYALKSTQANAPLNTVFAPLLAPEGSNCPQTLSSLARNDTGGWGILGLSPQGVVVARSHQVVVIPLDAQGAALGAPFELGQNTPLPAPLSSSAVSPQGTFYAWPESFALGVFARTVGNPITWLRWDASQAALRSDDIALSPSGNRVAWMRGDQLRLAERHAP